MCRLTEDNHKQPCLNFSACHESAIAYSIILIDLVHVDSFAKESYGMRQAWTKAMTSIISPLK